jgi:hypothetical protein
MKSQAAIDKLKGLIESRRLSTRKTESPTVLKPRTNVVVPILPDVQVPLNQNGWSTRLTRRGKPKFDSFESDQKGGWSPTLMTSFATNGLKLLPVAGYMGYKMFKNQRKTRKRNKRG